MDKVKSEPTTFPIIARPNAAAWVLIVMFSALGAFSLFADDILGGPHAQHRIDSFLIVCAGIFRNISDAGGGAGLLHPACAI